MSSKTTYVDVILPLALPAPFTYAVPVELAELIQVGHRVIVPFKTNKLYTGIVYKVHGSAPSVKPRLIETIVDEEPLVTPFQLKFWDWIAQYYMCTIGEVANAALPSGLKISSETKFFFNEYYEGDYTGLTDEAFTVVQALKARKELYLKDVQELLQKSNVHHAMQQLFNHGIAISKEELTYRYKPRYETFIKLHENYRSDEGLEKLFNETANAPKQQELLLAYIGLQKQYPMVKKGELLKAANCEPGVLKRMVEKNIFKEFRSEVSRLGIFLSETEQNLDLSATQHRAYNEIKAQLATKQ
ncbi:MAG: primosomal protein N', partial [Chitinophagales bacterium]|nr:primosomal protein N' [Chitinophagales bacterium]